MKGILLAGGSGTRLAPLTNYMSKQLLPVFDKPMIYYSLSCLLLAKIKDIIIVSTPKDISSYRALLGDGSKWGVNFDYVVQPSPDGLAQAFPLSEKYIKGSPVSLVLGDNIFYGTGLSLKLQESAKITFGAEVYSYQVRDPERYGVIEFDREGKVISIEEKPKKPKSNHALTGLYFYDEEVLEIAKGVKPSHRGELEITDVNKVYLERGALKVNQLNRGFSWLDTGTHSSLLEATNFISIVQERTNLQIGSPDEIAWRMGFISDDDLMSLGEECYKTEYGRYLIELAKGGL